MSHKSLPESSKLDDSSITKKDKAFYKCKVSDVQVKPSKVRLVVQHPDGELSFELDKPEKLSEDNILASIMTHKYGGLVDFDRLEGDTVDVVAEDGEYLLLTPIVQRNHSEKSDLVHYGLDVSLEVLSGVTISVSALIGFFLVTQGFITVFLSLPVLSILLLLALWMIAPDGGLGGDVFIILILNFLTNVGVLLVSMIPVLMSWF